MHGSFQKLDPSSKAQITAHDIPYLLDQYGDSIKVLSLDCFDTLLWRQTATPKDVFAIMAASPVAKALGVTVQQRISAAACAYRAKFIETGSRQIHVSDIYRSFAALNPEQQAQLVEAEIEAEIAACFAFAPYVELIRQAHARGIRVIIVSDTYLQERELRRLLSAHLPADVMQVISKVYCSVDYGTAKSLALFSAVIETSDVPAAQMLHIGDHETADALTPRKFGMQALHFQQFAPEVTNLLRLQHAASSLTVLGQPAPQALEQPRYSPFRPIFAREPLQPSVPETTVGYMSFGPLLYGYARFLTDEVEALRSRGKRVKVFFLLRDAYLLAQACEAYAGAPVGKLVRLRKFAAVAASFKTRADVDYYLSGIKPEHYNFHVIAEQLLLPPELIKLLLQVAQQSTDPQATFHHQLHQDDILGLIFNNSAAYRARLKRYILKEMQVEAGDTIVLADTGYAGVTQDYLARTFQDELQVEILGRYVLGSHEPDRPVNGQALITTAWCDHSLFEQSCTFKEGAVVDYDSEGEPVFEKIRLSDEQYDKAARIQAECLRFIGDAKAFFTAAGIVHDFSVLQPAAHAALFRHVYMPTAAEMDYFENFQLDKDMGPDRKKTVYNVKAALAAAKAVPSPHRFGVYDTRALGLDFTFSALMQRVLQLDLTPDDMNTRVSPLKFEMRLAQDSKVFKLNAGYLHDGYFSILLPYTSGVIVKMFLGDHYEWLQIDKVHLADQAGNVLDMADHIDLAGIERQGEIYRCLSPAGVATIRPAVLRQPTMRHHYRIVFRPLVARGQAA